MNKYKLYMIIGISSLVLSIGTTFAYYIWKSSTNAIVNLNICTPTITFAGGSTINGVDMIPVLTKEDGTIKEIEVKKNSTCNRDVTMNLYLELTTFPTELSDSSFKYELYKNSETMAIASGNFANKKEGDTITLLSNQILNTSKDTYTLYIYIDGNVDNPGTMAGKNFLFKLWGSGEGAIYKENVITTSDNPSASTSKFFNTEVMREEIQSLTIAEDNTVPDTPGVVSKDISQNQDETVMLWYTPKEVTSSDGSTKTMYDMWIGGENGVLQTGTNASGMFAYLTNIEKLDLSKLDTSYITNMSRMFYMSSGLKTIDLSNFDTSNVTTMGNMFDGCSSLTDLDLTNFDTSKVTSLSNMFQNCTNLKTLNISSFKTPALLYIAGMFNGCKSLIKLDLSNFDTSKVSNFSNLFQNCNSLEYLDLTSFNTSKGTQMVNMFRNCQKLKTLDLSSFNTSKIVIMSCMFYGCTSLVELNISSFDTSKVTDMSGMLCSCKALTELDLSNFNTSKVTNMSDMFNSCSSLTKLNLLKFDTSSLTDMSGMFYNCNSLTNLDLSSFNTSKVVKMAKTFTLCRKLTTIYVSDLWNTSSVTNSTQMFSNCTSLVGAASYNSTKVDISMANYTTGYLTYKSNN